MTRETAFLRIDDRLVHGQVIVGWLPEIKPDRLVVVNDKVSEDFMRQEMMALSVPPEIDLQFYSTAEIAADKVSDASFILVVSPRAGVSENVAVAATVMKDCFNSNILFDQQ